MKNKNTLPNEARIKLISGHFAEIMKLLNLDLKDASLKDTPDRVAKMYVNELCAGLVDDNAPKITVFPNDKGYDQMLVERNITVQSMCEHHFVPIIGKCHIAYIPNKKLIGLSKLIRTVQYFAAKPQLQERLTQEIAEFLQEKLETQNVAVVVDAVHYCCNMRGARDVNSSTITSYVGGVFRTQNEVRKEFYDNIKL